MELLPTLARWGATGFLGALALAVVVKLVLGRISLNGLLTGDRRDGSEYFSLGRLQLLLFTLFVATVYVKKVLTQPSLESLPEIPAATVAMLAGSHLFYLAGKARALFFTSSTHSQQ